MGISINRRRLLTGAVAGLVVTGFDPVARSWTTAASADPPDDAGLPDLDGVVMLDDPSLDAVSADEGYIVTRRPWATLRPGSVADIAAMVGFCRRYDVPLAARGRAHTVFGQGLVESGLVVEMEMLHAIHSIGPAGADVDAGVLWQDLFTQAYAAGLTPPIFTGYTAMTVGGTLSVGGVGILPRAGIQTETVRRLQIVTGAGRVVWCDATTEPELFHAALAGVGQYGLITRAVLDVVPAPDRVRMWSLMYTDPHAFFRDLRTLLDRGELDVVYGQFASPVTALLADPSPLVRPIASLLPLIRQLTGPLARGIGSVVTLPPLTAATPWMYVLNVGKYLAPGERPDGAALLRGMSDKRLLRQSAGHGYLDFVFRVDVLIELLQAAGQWDGVPHPWIDVFLPGEETEQFFAHTFAELRFDDVGLGGFALMFPILRRTITRPGPPMPASEDDWIFLFDILTAAPAPGPNRQFVADKLARNRDLYERARAVGGKLYAISAVPMERADWAQQYAGRYAELSALKAQHDPNGILTPGVRMF